MTLVNNSPIQVRRNPILKNFPGRPTESFSGKNRDIRVCAAGSYYSKQHQRQKDAISVLPMGKKRHILHTGHLKMRINQATNFLHVNALVNQLEYEQNRTLKKRIKQLKFRVFWLGDLLVHCMFTTASCIQNPIIPMNGQGHCLETFC